MKTDIHLWSYRAQFCSECEIFSDKSCRENQNTHFRFKNFLPLPPKNRAIYETMRKKNIVERGRSQMSIRLNHKACSIPKATNKHSEYAILIVFRRQQWLRERSSMLRYSKLPSFSPPNCSTVWANKRFWRTDGHTHKRLGILFRLSKIYIK